MTIILGMSIVGVEGVDPIKTKKPPLRSRQGGGECNGCRVCARRAVLCGQDQDDGRNDFDDFADREGQEVNSGRNGKERRSKTIHTTLKGRNLGNAGNMRKLTIVGRIV